MTVSDRTCDKLCRCFGSLLLNHIELRFSICKSHSNKFIDSPNLSDHVVDAMVLFIIERSGGSRPPQTACYWL